MYFDGSFEFEKDGLGDEDFVSFGVEVLNFGFKELNLFVRVVVLNFE